MRARGPLNFAANRAVYRRVRRRRATPARLDREAPSRRAAAFGPTTSTAPTVQRDGGTGADEARGFDAYRGVALSATEQLPAESRAVRAALP
jgi:hypothetical protein